MKDIGKNRRWIYYRIIKRRMDSTIRKIGRNKEATKMNLKTKIRGSLLGGAIGDALGYQIEFKRNIKEKEITRFKEKGIISDDTQMTLFTANALIGRETQGKLRGIAIQQEQEIYLGYKDWLDTKNHTKGDNCI